MPLPQNFSLTLDDYNRLNSVKLSYDIAFRPTTAKQDVSAFGHISDRRSGLLYSTSLLYDLSMKLITFIRRIPEFEFLNEQDRFILFKYNSPLVLYMRICLCYDINRDLVFDPEAQSEECAIACKQLSQYCYGEQLDLASTQLFRSIKNVTDDDPIILQLMLIILTFTKSLSVENIVANEQATFINSKQVDEAQSIYASLLFRYMIKKYSTYYQAARQYSQLIQKILRTQMLIRTFQQFFQEQLINTRDDELNPIMKSILNLQ
ncbi:unnamed protein product [Adineta steineri]|uniref:NR LBD domain-containing protein n=2 Tax=Adineta steineri TaxID=433720 RepID=A0A813QF64_9BILA|nr:unnamed protein product [Adineta steineri]